MSYYEIFGFRQEPFSTSPDPTFFWLSESHRAALFRLQVAVRLKRGLSVILGDVGMGKTTLSRRLFQALTGPDLDFKIIFTPFAKSETEFMGMLLEAFQLRAPESQKGFMMSAFSTIESYLLRQNLENGKTVVLLIDEAQCLHEGALEILRALLNYESHKEKLLQLILIGQLELLPKLTRSKNFWDRVNFKQVLRPLTLAETQKLIHFRLERAGWRGEPPIFTEGAAELIHQMAGGSPRRITRMAHDALEFAVMRDTRLVDRDLIEALSQEEKTFFALTESGHSMASGGETPPLPADPISGESNHICRGAVTAPGE